MTVLDRKKHYLQVALNSTLEDAYRIIQQLPVSDRIIIEAGTPLIKRYGEDGIRKIREWYASRLSTFNPYVVADLKMMDRGETEVEIARRAGASVATALGSAPIESLNAFIEKCEEMGLDAMIDMMNVDFPLTVLRALKKQPRVVILHRGVDEERDNKQKQLPLHEIRRIKGSYDMLIAVAGGDTLREIQSASFNDADIVVVWKNFYAATTDTGKLASEFLER